MKRAIISDIHSNLEAMEAVLKHIDSQNVDEIDCLGDLVGFGPNPGEVIDLTMEHVKICLMGNHDQATLSDLEGFNAGAEQAIRWTQKQIGRKTSQRWDFLGKLPRQHRDGDFLFVHGSPRNPLNEYVFKECIYDEKTMEQLFAMVPKYCFQGHTHVPGVITETKEFFSPADIENQYTLGSEKAMINVGSVGLPSDRDPRACYVTVEDDVVMFHRVEYDIEKTIEKILAADLDYFLTVRLRNGR